MISKRWTNGQLTAPTASTFSSSRPRPSHVPHEGAEPQPALWERPGVILGAALATGVAIGILMKWSWRR